MVSMRMVSLLRRVMYEMWGLMYEMAYRLMKWCSFSSQYFM